MLFGSLLLSEKKTYMVLYVYITALGSVIFLTCHRSEVLGQLWMPSNKWDDVLTQLTMTLFLMLVNTVQSWELIGFCMVVGSIYRTRTYTYVHVGPSNIVLLVWRIAYFFLPRLQLTLIYSIRHHDTPSFPTFHSRSNVQKIHSVQMTNSNQSLIKPHNKIKSRIEQTLYFLLVNK